MKKWILLFLGIFLFLVATANIAAADEYLYGKWRHEKPEGSSVLVFVFLAGEKGEIIMSYDDSEKQTQKQSSLPFSYNITNRVVAVSSIDEFREYIVDLNFQGRAVTIRILFRKDGVIEISVDKGQKLIFIKMNDEQNC